MLEIIYVFSIALLVDILWVLYIRAVSKDLALMASFLGTALYASSAYVTINYVADNYMLIPALLGAFVGTGIAMKLGKFLDTKNKQ